METFIELVKKARLKVAKYRIRPFNFEIEETDDDCPWSPMDLVPGYLQKRDIQYLMSKVPWPHFIQRFLETSTHDFKEEPVVVRVIWKPKNGTVEPIGIIITDEDRQLLDWCVNTSNTRCLTRNRTLIKTLIRALCIPDSVRALCV